MATNPISLKTILSSTTQESKEQSKAPLNVTGVNKMTSSQTRDPNQTYENYLARLNTLVSPELANKIASSYSLDEVLSMENLYDKFEFQDQPTYPVDKLNRVIKVLEWNKDLHSMYDMTDNYVSMVESFSGFEGIVQKLMDTKRSDITNDSFFLRDGFFGVSRHLLEYYGETPTFDNVKTGHAAREYKSAQLKVIPGITTSELTDFLLEKRISRIRIEGYSIVSGFDDVRTALEVACLVSNRSDAFKYVQNGFTSLEKVKAVNLDNLKELYTLFDFKGRLNSGTWHGINFKRFISDNIHGNPKRVDELADIGQKSGRDYLIAFNGSIEQTKRILKMPIEERPSSESVQYTRDVLKVFEFKETIAVAKEIDTPYKKTFDYPTKSKMDFLVFKNDYEKTLNDFLEKTGKKLGDNGDLSGFESFRYEDVKLFKGDLRFFKEFSIYQADKVKKLESLVDYDTYNSINVSYKGELLPKLFDNGYTLKEIKKAFNDKSEADGYKLYHNLEKFEEMGFSLSDMVGIINTAQRGEFDYALHILREVSFKEKGIPYSVINSLQANGVQPKELKTFIDTQGVGKYQSKRTLRNFINYEPTFDAAGMINDFNVFYNKNPTNKDRNKARGF